MLLLEYHNRIVENTVQARIERLDSEPDVVDITCADFDGVSFHLSTVQGQKALLMVSVSTRCYDALKKYGVEARLKALYGDLVTTPEATFDATLKIDCSKAPKKPEFYRKVALLKRHVLSAPFFFMAEAIEKSQKPELAEIRYRPSEAMYLKVEGNSLTVIFSIAFNDSDDVQYSKVFLNEFQDARKMQGAPAVSFTQKEPPLELKGVRNVVTGDKQGFVSVVLFAEMLGSAKRERTIDQILTLRNYLQYHIKCSKAHLHDRMRKRVTSLLQVLNRAKQQKPEAEKVKKTMTGKTFVK